jgi:hypothetical protein
MLLYTVQPRFVYDVLCDTGTFMSEPWKDADGWICNDAPNAKIAYDWLCDQMLGRGLRRPAPNVYPLLAWYQYMGKQRPKPDLRCSSMRHTARSGRQVLLSLDLPDEDALLHDYEAWHYPLNYFYLAAKRMSDRFERECANAGCALYQAVPLQNQDLHTELQRSWLTMFDLSACRRLFKRSRADQVVQATFWTLKAGNVTAAVEFGGGQRRRALPLPRFGRGS